MVSSITPAVLPAPTAQRLDPRAIARLRTGSFNPFQLDATAYPGNSGGPLFDPDTGEVLGVVSMVLVKGTRESALSQPLGITLRGTFQLRPGTARQAPVAVTAIAAGSPFAMLYFAAARL